MPDSNGKPLPGEWWGIRGRPSFYIVGYTASGEIVYQATSRQVFIGIHGWSKATEHLPDCTGWDWQAPDWVDLDPVNYGWHVLRKGVDQCRYEKGAWDYVGYITGYLLSEREAGWEFRCLRKDLPMKPLEPAKPGPTTWHTTNEDKILLWGAIHNMQAAIGRLEAQLRADKDRDKFFESVM